MVMKLVQAVACLLAMIDQICGANLDRKEYNVCNLKSDWDVVQSEEDCHKFYLCLNGNAEEYSCADNYYFDPKEKRCKIGIFSTMEAIDKCTPQSIRRINDNCQAFSRCENGEYVIQNCTKEQYFSTKYASCQPIATSADHKCSCLLPPYAIISNPDDCETYYICSDGKAVLQQCPRGQYYSEQISSCLPDLSGICIALPSMSSTELAMTEICSSFGNNIADFQPYIKECDKFSLCINGRMFPRRCPKGSYYDKNKRFCRWDVNEICTEQLNKLHEAIKYTVTNVNLDNQNQTVVPNVVNNIDKSIKKEIEQIKDFAVDQPNKSVYDKLSSKFINF
ncbi:peritrophin-48-like [Bactrocera tryoni]|uniref:peritrophin-48-like n=1 Tax=Bactrocera tryoni TaxID=59916 RepID=UPI001A9992C8|nr:peritrophin-48-like [Bactrocera tryoni]